MATVRIAIFCAFAVLYAQAASALVVDMRQCPLDKVRYIDEKSGDIFSVERVGTNYHYLCEDGDVVENVDDGKSCYGPYGDLILNGTLTTSQGSAERFYATWYVYKAAPCCGWMFAKESAGPLDNVVWLDNADVPKLGETDVEMIEATEEAQSIGFGGDKFPMECRTD